MGFQLVVVAYTNGPQIFSHKVHCAKWWLECFQYPAARFLTFGSSPDNGSIFPSEFVFCIIKMKIQIQIMCLRELNLRRGSLKIQMI